MRDYEQLHVWRRSHALVLAAFRASEKARRSGPPGLVGQLRRAAMAIPTNIAEGCGHDSRREFARFVSIAAASAVELQYLLRLSRDLGVIVPDAYAELAAETTAVRRMCRGLRKHLRSEEVEEEL
jgi:four helix bundle protein